MSNDIQNQIKAKIHAFAADLETLVRRAALEAVGGALGTTGAKRGRPVGSGKKPAAAAAAPKATAGKRGGKRVRRSPKAMDAAADQILKHIKGHPGERSEAIRAALGVQKNVWMPAVKKLIEDKKILSKGVKRATTYTAK